MGKVIDLGFNLGSVSDFQLPPEGTYEVECVSLKEGIGPSGSKYVAFEFQISDGKYKGVRIFDNASTAEAARFRIKRILRSLAHPTGEGVSKLEEDAVIGKKCIVETYIDTFTGREGKEQKSLKVNDYFSIDEKAQRMGGATQAAGATKPSFDD
jgi:hypothetical protein